MTVHLLLSNRKVPLLCWVKGENGGEEIRFTKFFDGMGHYCMVKEVNTLLTL